MEVQDKKTIKKEDVEELKIAQMTVEICYSENEKTLSECIFNILKRKLSVM